MIGIVTMVYVLAILLLAVGAVCFFFGVRFLQSSKKIKKKTMLQMKKLDKDVQNKYNRIALLSIGEFDNYMTKVFSMCMELASAESISDKDPDAAVKLYARTLERVITYLGPETIRALDYFYGKDYLVRWCELRYNMLNSRRYLPKIISKTLYAEGIEEAI